MNYIVTQINPDIFNTMNSVKSIIKPYIWNNIKRDSPERAIIIRK